MKTVIVTGAYGFLGRHTSLKFKQNGFNVYACGHGQWQNNNKNEWGIDSWREGDISLELLRKFSVQPDVIVHCAGSGSVGLSLSDPAADFHKTVSGTLDVLDFIRTISPETKLIYPSSAAVYGEHIDAPISTHTFLNPVSPYGVHKKIAEELCVSYHNHFGVNSSVIRFFSIYGEGLKKQLLWDASNRLMNQENLAKFWGTGYETRDWIHISDAVQLIYLNAVSSQNHPIMNGGSGIKWTVQDTLAILIEELGLERISLDFNNIVRKGDPRFYHADMAEAKQINWKPEVTLDEGIKRYVYWFKDKVK